MRLLFAQRIFVHVLTTFAHPRMKSEVMFHVYGLINHHTSPLHGTLRPLLEGYQVGELLQHDIFRSQLIRAAFLSAGLQSGNTEPAGANSEYLQSQFMHSC